MVEGKDDDAGRHRSDDCILPERIPAAEERDVEEQHRQKLACFGENKGDVVDVLERSVAKGRGERGCDGDEEDGWDDGARGKDWSDVAARLAGGAGRGRGGEVEVGVACERGEGGLDRIEDDGKVERFGSVGWAVCRCRYAFLEEGPG